MLGRYPFRMQEALSIDQIRHFEASGRGKEPQHRKTQQKIDTNEGRDKYHSRAQDGQKNKEIDGIEDVLKKHERKNLMVGARFKLDL
jgi:archaellum component FlaC